jgi:hypothetical protein
MAFDYMLLDETGNELGPFAAGVSNIAAGEILHRGHDRLEVLRVVDAEPDDAIYAYLVVTQRGTPS